MSIRILYLSMILLLLSSSCDTLGTHWTVNGCDLYPGTNCEGKNLSSALMTWQDLTESRFNNANLKRAVLSSSVFKKAILDGADLTGATIDGAIFDGASCIDTIWVDGTALTGPCVSETCRQFFAFEEDQGLTRADINGRFRDLALTYHPDKGGSGEQFLRLQDCRAELLDQL